MDDIKFKDFINTKTVKVCYIYGVELSDDETIKNIFYYRYSVEKKEMSCFCSSVSYFADKLINSEWIAYAGKITGTGDNRKMNSPSLVTVKTIDGVLYLTTASDDEESNNLASLPKYKANK